MKKITDKMLDDMRLEGKTFDSYNSEIEQGIGDWEWYEKNVKSKEKQTKKEIEKELKKLEIEKEIELDYREELHLEGLTDEDIEIIMNIPF